tara:strand:- start:720 stop:896 length:177 start_codon:yes stop_codon:yes gene_type:complete
MLRTPPLSTVKERHKVFEEGLELIVCVFNIVTLSATEGIPLGVHVVEFDQTDEEPFDT